MVTPDGRLLRGNNDESTPQNFQEPDDRNNVEKLVIALPSSTLSWPAAGGAATKRVSTPFHVIVRGTYVPQGPQAFSLVVTGPAVTMAASGSCGDVPAPSGLDPAPDPAVETSASLRASEAMYRIASMVLGAVSGIMVASNAAVCFFYRRATAPTAYKGFTSMDAEVKSSDAATQRSRQANPLVGEMFPDYQATRQGPGGVTFL